MNSTCLEFYTSRADSSCEQFLWGIPVASLPQSTFIWHIPLLSVSSYYLYTFTSLMSISAVLTSLPSTLLYVHLCADDIIGACHRHCFIFLLKAALLTLLLASISANFLIIWVQIPHHFVFFTTYAKLVVKFYVFFHSDFYFWLLLSVFLTIPLVQLTLSNC